jgi:homoserine dehydrogenase
MSADGPSKSVAPETDAAGLRETANAVGPCTGSVRRPPAAPFDLALIGTGQVGRAFLQRLATLGLASARHVVSGWAPDVASRIFRIVSIENSRAGFADDVGIDADEAIDRIGSTTGPATTSAPLHVFSSSGIHARIVVDATASDAIAGRHSEWLARGIHVVTANKLGQGEGLSRWRSIEHAAQAGRATYGNGATVGAGLPFIRTIQSLRAGGDRIVSLAGVLSGTLAWLFDRYDGTRPFSDLVREACALGYTEPDPWQDLAGHDVARKLLILARTSGRMIDAGQLDHAPIAPHAGTGDWTLLDGIVAERHAAARSEGRVLRHVARLDGDGHASVGLESLDACDPLAARGGDNRIVIHSCRYRDRPLTLQGPGAGAEVTAAALIDDALRIATTTRDRH